MKQFVVPENVTQPSTSLGSEFVPIETHAEIEQAIEDAEQSDPETMRVRFPMVKNPMIPAVEKFGGVNV
jgi:hypothetical protein